MSHKQVTIQILLVRINISSKSGLLLPDLHISLRNRRPLISAQPTGNKDTDFFFARVSVDCLHMCNFRLQRRFVSEESSLLEREAL